MAPIDAIAFYFRNTWVEVACSALGLWGTTPSAGWSAGRKAQERNKHIIKLSRKRSQEVMGPTTSILAFDGTLTRIENFALNTSNVECVFVAAVTFLQSRCVLDRLGVHLGAHYIENCND
jgi:hypothetical protein